MKILLTGSRGFVGSRIARDWKDTIIPCPSLQGLDRAAVHRIVKESEADVILHTAAISDIGTCANSPEASFHANVELPVWIAESAGSRKLICFSSDQVYSGCNEEGPYDESTVKPANLYAEHKLQMENRVLELQPDAVMLRAEWMYDFGTSRANFLNVMLNAKDSVSFSSRQYRGITYLKEVSANVPALVTLPGGAYNFGSETTDNMNTIARNFASLLGKCISVNDAPARHNLWMNCDKARKYGVVFSEVSAALAQCAADYELISRA